MTSLKNFVENNINTPNLITKYQLTKKYNLPHNLIDKLLNNGQLKGVVVNGQLKFRSDYLVVYSEV